METSQKDLVEPLLSSDLTVEGQPRVVAKNGLGSQYILQYAAYQKSPLVLGGYTLFLLWRHGWWLIPRIHSCRSSRINERCSFDTGRALHCTYLYTHQPGTPD